MKTLSLPGSKALPGTTRAMRTIADVVVDSTVVCCKAGVVGGSGTEYTVTATRAGIVELESKGRKYKVKIVEFVTSFERRIGPVVPESLRKGLKIRALVTDKKYNAGDVLTITETGGRRYDFRTASNTRGSIDRDELQTSFIYV